MQKGSHRAHHKPIYKWRACGYGDMKRAIALLYPWLSPRRKEQAHRLLANPPDPNGRRYSAEKLAEFDTIEVPGWTMPERTGDAEIDVANGILR